MIPRKNDPVLRKQATIGYMPLITKVEASLALGVSKTSVYKAIEAGRLSVVRTSDGRELINSETMRAEWNSKTQQRVGVGPKPPAGTVERTPLRPHELSSATPSPSMSASAASSPSNGLAATREPIPDYNESRARTEHLKAELLELERKEKEKLLVKADEIEAKWVEIVTLARTKLLGIPTKAKQRIPDLDTDAIGVLDAIVREALEDLAT